MKLACVFPGQGSQSVGMLAGLAEGYPVVRETFAAASEVLGYDLWKLAQDGPAEDLNRTDRTQPAMLAAGVAAWGVWQARGGPAPAFMAGHSLGEYTALVCAGSMTFEDAVGLVADRGRFMQEAVPQGDGAMAAVLGLDDDQVVAVCESAAQGDVVSAVNFNAPGQVVVAGTAAAVQRTVEAAKRAGAKRAIVLPVSVPSHCALMRPAAERLVQRLEAVAISPPSVPVIHNVDAAPHTDPADIRRLLASQLHSPVRWVDTVQFMGEEGVDTLIECGPGKVLVGLNRRIERRMKAVPVLDADTLDKALASIEG